MASGPDSRQFSFQVRDDDPAYHPLPAPPRDQQRARFLAPQHAAARHRVPSDGSVWDTPSALSEDEDESGSGGLEQQNTVIRKPVAPASAAAAAAALAPVREHLIPQQRPPPAAYSGRVPVGQRQSYAAPASLDSSGASTPMMSAAAAAAVAGAAGRGARYNDPVLGQYSDNPYKRMSTTWDPSLAQSGFDGAHDILSDDDDHEYGRSRNAATAASGAGGVAAGVPGGVLRGGTLRGGAVERGGLLSSTLRAAPVGLDTRRRTARSSEDKEYHKCPQNPTHLL